MAHFENLNSFFSKEENAKHFSNMLERARKNLDANEKTVVLADYIGSLDTEKRNDLISDAIVKSYENASKEKYSELPFKLFLYKAIVQTVYNAYYRKVKRAQINVAMAERLASPEAEIIKYDFELVQTDEIDRLICEYKIQGFNNCEIANALNVSETAIRKRLHKMSAYYHG